MAKNRNEQAASLSRHAANDGCAIGVDTRAKTAHARKGRGSYDRNSFRRE